MNRFEKAAYFGHMMGKVAAGQGLGAGQSNKEVDDILGSFNDLKKPVDPKALMAERAVHRYEPTFQANPQTRPQLSNKDISGMQSAFGGPPAAQKPAPKSPMMAPPPNAAPPAPPAPPASGMGAEPAPAPTASYAQPQSSTPFRSNRAARNPGGFFSRRGR
jgi:hypothetical protein